MAPPPLTMSPPWPCVGGHCMDMLQPPPAIQPGRLLFYQNTHKYYNITYIFVHFISIQQWLWHLWTVFLFDLHEYQIQYNFLGTFVLSYICTPKGPTNRIFNIQLKLSDTMKLWRPSVGEKGNFINSWNKLVRFWKIKILNIFCFLTLFYSTPPSPQYRFL